MIYLASHVPYEFPDSPVYQPIQVGRAIDDDLHLPYQDNIGENISAKNRHYCELTAYYWVWKNTQDDIVGIGHYRRIPTENGILFTEERLREIFKDHDFITNGNIDLTPSKENYSELMNNQDMDIPGSSLYSQYARCHKRVDMDLAWYYIREHCPEYEEDFVNQVVFGTLFIPCNILVAPREVFNGFCKWLFDILFFVEKHSPYKTYDDYNQRVFGFLAERLFAVYFYHNKLRSFACSTTDLKENMLNG